MSTILDRNATVINKKFTEYFIPTVLTAMANNIAIIINSVLASRLQSETALAAINLVQPIHQLFFALSIMFGIGASTIIGIAKGAGDEKKVQRAFSAIWVAIGIFSVISVGIFLPLADVYTQWQTSDVVLQKLLHDYYVPSIIGMPSKLIFLSSLYFLRLDNRPQFPTAAIIVANFITLGTNYLFMGVLGYGIGSAAWAMNIGWMVGIVLVATHFFSKKASLKPTKIGGIKSFLSLNSEMLSIGLAGALIPLLIVIRLQFLNSTVETLGGSVAMITYSLCLQSNILVSLFITGASQTMVPIIGVCLGEKDYKGIRYVMRQTIKIVFVATGLICIFIVICPNLIASFFGIKEGGNLAQISLALRWNALSILLGAGISILTYYYISIKQKTIGSTISILNGLALLVPTTLLCVWIWNLDGVWISFPATQIVTIGVLAVILSIAQKKSGNHNIFLLPESDKSELVALSLSANKLNATKISQQLHTQLLNYGIGNSLTNRLSMVCEDIIAEIYNNCNNRKIDVDVILRRNEDDNITIMVRHNGKPYDMTQSHSVNDMPSNMDIIKTLVKKVEYSNVLGFNRLIITL